MRYDKVENNAQVCKHPPTSRPEHGLPVYPKYPIYPKYPSGTGTKIYTRTRSGMGTGTNDCTRTPYPYPKYPIYPKVQCRLDSICNMQGQKLKLKICFENSGFLCCFFTILLNFFGLFGVNGYSVLSKMKHSVKLETAIEIWQFIFSVCIFQYLYYYYLVLKYIKNQAKEKESH